eukprot:6187451-Pleurochrysis_carterae.AAC.1
MAVSSTPQQQTAKLEVCHSQSRHNKQYLFWHLTSFALCRQSCPTEEMRMTTSNSATVEGDFSRWRLRRSERNGVSLQAANSASD